MKLTNFSSRQRRIERKEQAMIRLSKYNILTAEEKIALLDKNGHVAKRQRERLAKELNK